MATWYEKLVSDMGYTPTWCREENTDEEIDREETTKMINRKEVLQALRTIAAVCIEYSHSEGGCKECPLRSQNISGGCGIVGSEPEMWDIMSEVESWHAFV